MCKLASSYSVLLSANLHDDFYFHTEEIAKLKTSQTLAPSLPPAVFPIPATCILQSTNCIGHPKTNGLTPVVVLHHDATSSCTSGNRHLQSTSGVRACCCAFPPGPIQLSPTVSMPSLCGLKPPKPSNEEPVESLYKPTNWALRNCSAGIQMKGWTYLTDRPVWDVCSGLPSSLACDMRLLYDKLDGETSAVDPLCWFGRVHARNIALESHSAVFRVLNLFDSVSSGNSNTFAECLQLDVFASYNNPLDLNVPDKKLQSPTSVPPLSPLAAMALLPFPWEAAAKFPLLLRNQKMLSLPTVTSQSPFEEVTLYLSHW